MSLPQRGRSLPPRGRSPPATGRGGAKPLRPMPLGNNSPSMVDARGPSDALNHEAEETSLREAFAKLASDFDDARATIAEQAREIDTLREAIAVQSRADALGGIERRLLRDLGALHGLQCGLRDLLVHDIAPRVRSLEASRLKSIGDIGTLHGLLMHSIDRVRSLERATGTGDMGLDGTGDIGAHNPPHPENYSDSGQESPPASIHDAPYTGTEQQHWHMLPGDTQWRLGMLPGAPPLDSVAGRWVTDPATMTQQWVEEPGPEQPQAPWNGPRTPDIVD